MLMHTFFKINYGINYYFFFIKTSSQLFLFLALGKNIRKFSKLHSRFILIL